MELMSTCRIRANVSGSCSRSHISFGSGRHPSNRLPTISRNRSTPPGRREAIFRAWASARPSEYRMALRTGRRSPSSAMRSCIWPLKITPTMSASLKWGRASRAWASMVRDALQKARHHWSGSCSRRSPSTSKSSRTLELATIRPSSDTKAPFIAVVPASKVAT